MALQTYTDIPNMDLDLEMFSTASLSCGENGKIIDVNPAAETVRVCTMLVRVCPIEGSK